MNAGPDPEPSAEGCFALYHSALHPSLSLSPLSSAFSSYHLNTVSSSFSSCSPFYHPQAFFLYILKFFHLKVTTKLQNTSFTLTLFPQLAPFQIFSSVLTFSFIFSIFFTELRRTGLSSSLTLASVSGERGVWRSSWRAPRPICFSSCFSASFSLLSALMLSELYMWYVFITCRVERGTARLTATCYNPALTMTGIYTQLMLAICGLQVVLLVAMFLWNSPDRLLPKLRIQLGTLEELPMLATLKTDP